jgi:Flp pilus assembly protein TadG
MKRFPRSFARQSQEGSVAVEAAVCIALILVPLLFFVYSFGKFFWHYTVVQKALHDATLYMAKAPLGEVRSGAATQLASSIIESETADLDSQTKITSWSQCGFKVNNSSFFMIFGNCNTQNAPFAVQTNAFMTVPDPFYFGNSGNEINLTLTATMRHAGN